LSNLTVSVIVPTRNRPQILERCLDSIISSHSSYAYDELILVDNGSDEVVARLNRQLAEKYRARYCWEGRRGVSFARNTGVKIARADIVVFADDDFIVDRDWVKNLLPNYEDEQVMGCAGRMIPYRRDEASSLFNRTMGYDRGGSRRVFTASDASIIKLLKAVPLIGRMRLGDRAPVPWAIGSGFLSFRRCVFDEVGYLDEGLLDPRVSTFCCGEDVDILYRVLKNGYKVVYEPKAVVSHDDPQTIQDIVNKSYSYGVSRQVFFSKYRRDHYILVLCLGSFFFSMFAWIRATLKLEREERKVVAAGIRGFFAGISR